MKIGEIKDFEPITEIGKEMKLMIENGDHLDAHFYWFIKQYESLKEDTQFYKEQYEYAEKERSEWVKRYNEESILKTKYRNAFECLYEKATSKNV